MNSDDEWFRPCVCKWYHECNHMTKLFASNGTNDVRGDACIGLDLSGDAEMKKIRHAVLKILGTNENGTKNIKDFIVARHHWTAKQLKCVFSQRG